MRLYCTWTACTLGSVRCVEKAEGFLRRFGGWVVLVAKFIARARVFVPPIAGASALSFRRFVLFDGAGSLLWSALVVSLGALLGRQWEQAASGIETTYRFLGLALAALLGGYLAWKLTRRRFGAPRLSLKPTRDSADPESKRSATARTPGLRGTA